MFATEYVFSGKKNGELQQQIDIQEQYSRRSCLLIHGIKERRHEVTDELTVQTIKSEMSIDINVKDFDRTHRIGAKAENKRRSTIVKFVRYSERQKLFNNKERFKRKNFYIVESLTKKIWFSKCMDICWKDLIQCR